MKERPILFSAPMVRALLNGSKTQTRRIAPISKLDIQHHGEGMLTWGVHFSKPIKGGVLSSHSGGQFTEQDAHRIIASQFCPYGKPGDRLWVRETVARRPASTLWIVATNGVESAYYRADGEDVVDQNDFNICPWFNGPVCVSIHMPRWASRITLEITSVRIERLQDISEADAMAEGYMSGASDIELALGYRKASPILWYQLLWESINGPGSWAANPWVWVVEFRVVSRERAA